MNALLLRPEDRLGASGLRFVDAAADYAKGLSPTAGGHGG